jgi:hypothetical protein
MAETDSMIAISVSLYVHRLHEYLSKTKRTILPKALPNPPVVSRDCLDPPWSGNLFL